jgi:MFS family permease
MELDYNKTFIHNFIVNVLDGAFFGFALGFASFVTLLPLFVSTMTNSAILIGLIPAVHTVGWQFPQLLIANHVSKQKKFLPLVLWLTIHERLPFLGLALTAWFLPIIGVKIGLIFTFIMLIWQGLGGGFTASAWQAMISKIIPGERRGTFLGTQASASSLLGALGAVLSGLTLERFTHPINFSLCFIFACIPMVFSFIFLMSLF